MSDTSAITTSAQHELNEALVRELYALALGREPRPDELSQRSEHLISKDAVLGLARTLRNSAEFKNRSRVKLEFHPGHFFSPIVDPETVRAYFDKEQTRTPDEILGIAIDAVEMAKTWDSWEPILATTDFDLEPGGTRRFNLANRSFPYGDALVLRSMIASQRCRQIIEVGSGYSTACILDTIDEFGLDTVVHCIDPHPHLNFDKAISAADRSRVKLTCCEVQTVDVSLFQELDAGDILFIDSTHVMKTASDVHFELFYILPALKPGVIVHFHDCAYPFEYNAQWVFEANRSWNEVYALRAFLMYNFNFKIKFWLSFLKRTARERLGSAVPNVLTTAASSLWLERL